MSIQEIFAAVFIVGVCLFYRSLWTRAVKRREELEGEINLLQLCLDAVRAENKKLKG